jgi:hypothetical protein
MKNNRSKLIGRYWRHSLLFASLLLALYSRSQADGGGVALHQLAGPYVVTVFIAPATPRAGPVDVSVVARDRADGRAAIDVEVFVRLRREGGIAVVGHATRGVKQNELFYSVLMNLPEAGQWELEVTIKRGKSEASVFGQLSVAAPRPFLLSYWRSLSLPWVVITLFAMNQWLKGRAASRGEKRLTTHPTKLRCETPIDVSLCDNAQEGKK